MYTLAYNSIVLWWLCSNDDLQYVSNMSRELVGVLKKNNPDDVCGIIGPTLKRLRDRGYLTSIQTDINSAGFRIIYYVLTPKGRRAVVWLRALYALLNCPETMADTEGHKHEIIFSFDMMILLWIKSHGSNYQRGLVHDLSGLTNRKVYHNSVRESVKKLTANSLLTEKEAPRGIKGAPKFYYTLTTEGEHAVEEIQEIFRVIDQGPAESVSVPRTPATIAATNVSAHA